MLQTQKVNIFKKWIGRIVLAGIGFMAVTYASPAALAQIHPEPTPPPAGCPLIRSGQPTGNTDGFIISNYNDGTISIQIAEPDTTGWGLWSSTDPDGGTVTLTAIVNANVNVTTPADNTKEVVYITASKVDPNLSTGSFSVSATTSYGHHIEFNVEVNCPPVTHGCTLTQGFWKNKPAEWPTTSLTIGTVNYSKTQLITILKTAVRGNGLTSLSHQLIAAKLNVLNDASVPPSVFTAIGLADGQIGALIVPSVGTGFLSPDSTSALTSTLDTYNNGRAIGGPPHCED